MYPAVCVSTVAEDITNSVITRDYFPIIFFPKHFLCWRCYENLRNYSKNTVFKNKFLLYFLNIKLMYVHHRKKQVSEKEATKITQIQPTERTTVTLQVDFLPALSLYHRNIFLNGLIAQHPIL